ncbi:hypothetical protein [Actinomadura sp. 3N508]|uniref:hypothetical protein n=1 Tax=Actinomadura sp. 3N508 TaxID=3375153 RepID=UPI0037B1D437
MERLEVTHQMLLELAGAAGPPLPPAYRDILDLLTMAGEGDHDAQALIGRVRQLWDDPALRRLLLRETAAGWPPHLGDTGPRPPAGD